MLGVVREMKEDCARASRGRRQSAEILQRETEAEGIEKTLTMGKFHGSRVKWGFPSIFDETVTYSAIQRTKRSIVKSCTGMVKKATLNVATGEVIMVRVEDAK